MEKMMKPSVTGVSLVTGQSLVFYNLSETAKVDPSLVKDCSVRSVESGEIVVHDPSPRDPLGSGVIGEMSRMQPGRKPGSLHTGTNQ